MKLHLNKNSQDNSPENIVEASKAEIMVLNHKGGITENPEITLLNLMVVRLDLARKAAIKGTPLEKEERGIKDRAYRRTGQGRVKESARHYRYWHSHAENPEWREEYNRKQRERRHRKKLENEIYSRDN